MPEILRAYREAAAQNSADAIGAKTGQPTTTAGDQKISPQSHPDVWAMRIDDSKYMPLQDLDPASPTFGMDRFVDGLDIPGDPTKYIP